MAGRAQAAAAGVDRTPRGSLVRAATAPRRQRTRGSMNSPALRGQTRGPRRHVLAWGRIRPPPSAAPAARGQQHKRSSPPADRDRPRCRGPDPDTTIESRPTRRGLLRAEPAAGRAHRPLSPAALSSAPALTSRAAGRTRAVMLYVTPTTGRALAETAEGSRRVAGTAEAARRHTKSGGKCRAQRVLRRCCASR